MPHQIPLKDSSRNQTTGQMPSEDLSRNEIVHDQIPSGDPSQTDTAQATAPPSNNKSSTFAPGKRRRVSVPFLSLF